MAISIKQQGLVQPIIVRVHPELPTNYELVAGERRLRAVKLLGWTTIPALIRPYSDVQLQQSRGEMLKAGSKCDRRGPSSEKLVGKFANYSRTIGSKIGKSRTAISNALRLLACQSISKPSWRRERVSVGQGAALT